MKIKEITELVSVPVTKKYLQFNINEYIMIKLNDKGRKYLEEQHYNFWMKWVGHSNIHRHPYIPLKENNEGYVIFQMWSFLSLFGNYFDSNGLSCDDLFDTNVLIEIVGE